VEDAATIFCAGHLFFMRRSCGRLLIAISVLLLSSFAFAQQSQSAVITYSLDFPGSEPDHYFFSVASDGKASYESTGKVTQDSPADPYHDDFVLSDATRNRIFDLVKGAGYFARPLDSSKKGIAFTGRKTLTYQEGSQNNRADFDYSPSQSVRDLVHLFASISATLEFGRRLDFDYRYQKLALDAELKSMEGLQQEGDLAELGAIRPVLRKIASDTSLVNVARARAQRLLASADAK
jgi:hypothetical protein